jgi:hypothetical protein
LQGGCIEGRKRGRIGKGERENKNRSLLLGVFRTVQCKPNKQPSWRERRSAAIACPILSLSLSLSLSLCVCVSLPEKPIPAPTFSEEARAGHIKNQKPRQGRREKKKSLILEKRSSKSFFICGCQRPGSSCHSDFLACQFVCVRAPVALFVSLLSRLALYKCLPSKNECKEV